MGMLDVHAHYDMYLSKEELLSRIKNYTAIILNGMDESSNKHCLSYAGGVIKVAMGYHPCSISSKEDVIAAKKTMQYILSKKKEIVAIGEIGLDYFHTKDKKIQEFQKKVFLDYLSLAEKLQLPVILHTRNAVSDILELLQNFKQPVILHCFEASTKNIQEAVKRKYYFSIPPAIIRNDLFRRIVEHAPVSQLLTETDAPYQGPVKGVDAQPDDVALAITEIAKIKALDAHEVQLMILQNYQKIF